MDKVAHRASAQAHQQHYAKQIQEMLHETFPDRGTQWNERPSALKNLAMLHACVQDMFSNFLLHEERNMYESPTKKWLMRKQSEASKRKSVAGSLSMPQVKK